MGPVLVELMVSKQINPSTPINSIAVNCGSANLGWGTTAGEFSPDVVDRKIFLARKLRPEGRERAALKARASEMGKGWLWATEGGGKNGERWRWDGVCPAHVGLQGLVWVVLISCSTQWGAMKGFKWERNEWGDLISFKKHFYCVELDYKKQSTCGQTQSETRVILQVAMSSPQRWQCRWKVGELEMCCAGRINRHNHKLGLQEWRGLYGNRKCRGWLLELLGGQWFRFLRWGSTWMRVYVRACALVGREGYRRMQSSLVLQIQDVVTSQAPSTFLLFHLVPGLHSHGPKMVVILPVPYPCLKQKMEREAAWKKVVTLIWEKRKLEIPIDFCLDLLGQYPDPRPGLVARDAGKCSFTMPLVEHLTKWVLWLGQQLEWILGRRPAVSDRPSSVRVSLWIWVGWRTICFLIYLALRSSWVSKMHTSAGKPGVVLFLNLICEKEKPTFQLPPKSIPQSQNFSLFKQLCHTEALPSGLVFCHLYAHTKCLRGCLAKFNVGSLFLQTALWFLEGKQYQI